MISLQSKGLSDDTTLRAESEEEPKSLLMRVIEESEKAAYVQDIGEVYCPKTRIKSSGEF